VERTAHPDRRRERLTSGVSTCTTGGDGFTQCFNPSPDPILRFRRYSNRASTGSSVVFRKNGGAKPYSDFASSSKNRSDGFDGSSSRGRA